MNLNGLIWYGTVWIIGLALIVYMKKIQDKDAEFQRAIRESLDYDEDNLLGDFVKFLGLMVGFFLYTICSIALAHMLGNFFLLYITPQDFVIAWECGIGVLIFQGAIVYAIWEKKPDNQTTEASSD